MKTAYFILGVHRSGTSALGGVLNIMGLDFGSDLVKAGEDNPKGFFENSYVLELNEIVLRENGSLWDGYDYNVRSLNKEQESHYVAQAKKILEDEFRYSKKFVIKDPRICLLFPIWEKACLELGIEIKIILPYRNPMEVAISLKKRNGYSIEKGLILWSKHFLSAEFLSRGYERTFISFDQLLSSTTTVVDSLYDFIRLKGWKKRNEINEFLDKNIKHNNISIENITKEIPWFLQNLLDYLKNSKFDELSYMDSIRSEFHFSLELFQHVEIVESLLNEKKQAVKISELTTKTELQCGILDIALLDEEYYLKTNPDIQCLIGSISEHYFNFGKNEGRKPNRYCEHYNIDTKEFTANDEVIYRLKNSLKNKSQELETQEAKNKELNTTNLTLDAQLDEVLSDIKTLKERNTELVKNSEAEIEKRDNSLTELETQKESLNQELQSKSQELETKEAKNEELNTTNLTLDAQLDEVLSDIKTLKERNTELVKNSEAEIEKRDNSLTELETQKESLNQELQSKSQELETKEAKNEELNTTNLTLNAQLDEVLSDIEILKERHTEFVKNSEAEIEKRDNSLTELETQKESLNQELQSKSQELETKEAKNEELNTINLTLNAQLDEVLSDIEILKERHTEFVKNSEAEIEKRDNSLTEQATQKKSLNQELQSKEQALRSKFQELETREAKNKELNTINLTLMIQIKEKQQESQELNKAIDEIVNDLLSIKESKCWLYTKPLRDMQQVFKVKKNE